MYKRWILALSMVTLIIIGVAAVIIAIAMGSVASACTPSSLAMAARCHPRLGLGTAAALVAPCALLALALGVPAWGLALAATIERKQWGWFWLILFLSPIATLMYGLSGPMEHHS
jgi:hypothetical protein